MKKQLEKLKIKSNSVSSPGLFDLGQISTLANSSDTKLLNTLFVGQTPARNCSTTKLLSTTHPRNRDII